MSFSSLTFFFFLISVFSFYHSCRRRKHQNIVLVFASYFFYGWWDYRFCFLMFFSSVLDYFIGHQIYHSKNIKQRKCFLILSLCANLGLLGFFKYYNFFLESFATLLEGIGTTTNLSTLSIILPVGISFYTFQTLSYSIDIYLKNETPSRDFWAYMAFVSFFPQLVAGPIERSTHLIPQFKNNRSFSYDRALSGLRLMLWGYLKKAAIADNLSPIVDTAFNSPSYYSGPILLVATIAFPFQIYCDFSAYSDIAVGTARLFGIELMRNFNYPFFSRNLREFWKRWHISLSSWFRDYIYIPLGGNRCSLTKNIRNIITTFLLSGLWHGASWNFVAWGGIHGLCLTWESLFCKSSSDTSKAPTLSDLFPILRTFAIVCLAFVFFRAETLSDAIHILTKIGTELWAPVHYQQLASFFSIEGLEFYGSSA